VRARDSHGSGRCRTGRSVTNVLTTSGKLASGTRCELGTGAYRRISLGRGGRGIVGITLRGYEKGIEGVVLTTLERMRIRKGIAFIGNLCLRGKVGKIWRRTLVVLGMVSPIVVLSRGGLRVAPNNKRDKISDVQCHKLKRPHLSFDLSLLKALSLLCFEL